MPITSIPIDKIQVPLPIVLGKYEYLSDEELNEHITDLTHEQERRVEARRDS